MPILTLVKEYMYQVICFQAGRLQNKFNLIIQISLAVFVFFASLPVSADTTAPYSKPFHNQGRGWYPSIYWSTGRNLGSFYFPNTNGPIFEELSELDWQAETHALIYFYRPASQWASEELEAPSYYINDEVIFNLRGGSYTYVELPAGSYDFAVRKSLLPLLGFEAFDDKTMMAFDLNLQADFGFTEERIDETAARNAAAKTSLSLAKNEIIQADPYETVTRLEEAQFQLEAIYTVTARSSSMSLLSFMR